MIEYRVLDRADGMARPADPAVPAEHDQIRPGGVVCQDPGGMAVDDVVVDPHVRVFVAPSFQGGRQAAGHGALAAAARPA